MTLPPKIDSLWLDCHLATMAGTEPYGMVKNGAVAVCDGEIAWVGPAAELPSMTLARAERIRRLDGGWITPGLIDCHTHLVYAGDRAGEFEMRMNGATYEDIARAGGGIISTVNAVRAATEQELFEQSADRLQSLLSEGVSTVEIKSGYGLETASELKMLRTVCRLGHEFPVTVSPTFLGAHALPPEYTGRSDDYIDLVIEEMLPAVADNNLATAVDVFCEQIAFTVEQAKRLFKAAALQGLSIKIHAEQLSNQKGALMAAHHNALSADHLEYIEEDGINAMTNAGTVAVPASPPRRNRDRAAPG